MTKPAGEAGRTKNRQTTSAGCSVRGFFFINIKASPLRFFQEE
jgi:hypothetical protein